MHQRSAKILAVLTTMSIWLVVFGVPGSAEEKLVRGEGITNPAIPQSFFPQHDQPNYFRLELPVGDEVPEGTVLFTSAPSTFATYRIEILSTGGDGFIVRSPGFGARLDFTLEYIADSCAEQVYVSIAEIEGKPNENNVALGCGNSIIASATAPRLIFSSLSGAVSLKYRYLIRSTDSNPYLATASVVILLIAWIIGLRKVGLFCRARQLLPVRRGWSRPLAKFQFTDLVLSSIIITVATVTMPPLIDDGSVLSILKAARQDPSQVNNIFSASAAPWPLGTGAIALFAFILGDQPSIIAIRLVILVLLLLANLLIWNAFRWADRIRGDAPGGPHYGLLAFAAIASGWGVTLRLELVVLVLGSLALNVLLRAEAIRADVHRFELQPLPRRFLDVSKPHFGKLALDMSETQYQRSISLLILASFVSGIALGVAQTGLVVVGAVVAYITHLSLNGYRFKIFVFGASALAVGLGLLLAQPWFSLRLLSRRASYFSEVNGSLHDTSITGELGRYTAALSEGAVRHFGVLIIIGSLVGAVFLIGRSIGSDRASGIMVMGAFIGLMFTSSRWQWHLLALAPFAAFSLEQVQVSRRPASAPLGHIQVPVSDSGHTRPAVYHQEIPDDLESAVTHRPSDLSVHSPFGSAGNDSLSSMPPSAWADEGESADLSPDALRPMSTRISRAALHIAVFFAALTALTRLRQPLTGSTPDLRDQDYLSGVHSAVDDALSYGFGPVPIVVVGFLGIMLFPLAHVDKAVGKWLPRLPYLLVFCSTVLVLSYGSTVAESPSHVGLPIHEFRSSEGCGWLDQYGEVDLPVSEAHLQVEVHARPEELVDHLRGMLQSAEWVPIGNEEQVLTLASNEALFIRNVVNEQAVVSIDGQVQNFNAQPWSEVRLGVRPQQDTRLLRVSGDGAMAAVIAADRWITVGVGDLARGLNGLVDPVYHVLTPCVESVATTAGMFNGFDWTISDPRATDLGQSFPLDIGVRHAAQLGLIRVNCPQFSTGLDLGQCFYLYQASPRIG